jgi:hypothetical protein
MVSGEIYSPLSPGMLSQQFIKFLRFSSKIIFFLAV